MIKDFRTAYKIGFSSALDPNTTSAYSDMAKWGLVTCTNTRVINGFIKGYASAIRTVQGMGKSNQVEYQFESQDHRVLFKV